MLVVTEAPDGSQVTALWCFRNMTMMMMDGDYYYYYYYYYGDY